VTTAAQAIEELADGARWIVVSPIAMPPRTARLAVLHSFSTFPAIDEVGVLVRPDLVGDRVYVIDREAIGLS
jgi:hypothetical protein